MRGSIIGQLILKDWRVYRAQILFTLVGGAIALTVVQWRRDAPLLVGVICFFISLVVVGHTLPIFGIVNERKNQNLAFLMSLPLSSIQYTTAKLISTLGMYLVSWLTLVTAAVLVIETRGFIPRGCIPMLLIFALFPFIGACVMTGAALVGETEGWGHAANLFCNIAYPLVWPFLFQIPGLTANISGPTPVWNSTVFKILGAELGLIVLILALTYYLQSRKRGFV